MEPPAAASATALHDEKVKVFRQIDSFRPEHVSRGQYRGYRDEPGVDPNSDTETFVATRFEIESWRWAGVPWLVRSGKAMPVTATEAIVEFKARRGCCLRTRAIGTPNRTTCASGSAPTTASCCTCRPRRRATSWRPGP